MRFKLCSKLFFICALLIALPVVAAAQRSHPPVPKRNCHNDPHICLERMLSEARQIKAYLVAHVKPGDPVEFNPQPDPPGDPDPWFRKANQIYFGLTQDFADFSNNESDLPIVRPSPERRAAFHSAVGDAQEKLSRLGQRADRRTITVSLAAFTNSLNRISPMLASK